MTSKISLESFKQYAKFKRILLLFSGGLDTSFLLKFFSKELNCEVISVSYNLTTTDGAADMLTKRAIDLGAKQHLTIDLTNEFLQDYCIPAIKANARYNGLHPLSSSLSRPLIAKTSVALAKKYNCDAIMHGSAPLQNNAARFNNAFNSITQELKVLTPIIDLNLSREKEFEYLKSQEVIIDKKEDDLLSSDENIWSREIEDGVLETYEVAPNNQIYALTNSIEKTPDVPQTITLEFKNGIPISLNQTIFEFEKIVNELNKIGGKHGIGRFDALEDRVSGVKMREIHESPAAHILILAHEDLENSLLPRKLRVVKKQIDQIWTETVCFGFWNHPLKNALDAFIEKTNQQIEGTIILKLYKGNATIIGRKIKLKNKTNLLPTRNFFDIYGLESHI